jgi:nicotinate phosphoribosyltransferase
VVMLEKEMPKGKNVKKLTVDYIKNGEKIKENYRLLGLEEAKKYYEDNLLYLQKIYSEKEKRNRINLSENLKNLKENLIKRKKVDI